MACSAVLAFWFLSADNPPPMRTFLFSLLVPFAFLPTVVEAATPDAFSSLDATTIAYFESEGILQGALDGSVYLASDITRAEFVRAVVEYVYPERYISPTCLEGLDTDPLLGISYELLFRDVSKDAPYALHLCVAMRSGMISGYTDGTFRPYDSISLAEASKVISVAFNLGYRMPMYQTDDWYANYLQTVRKYTVFPSTITSPDDALTVLEARTLLQNVSAKLATYHGSEVQLE